MAAATLWFLVYSRRTQLPTPSEPRPLPLDRRVRFLLTTPVPEPPGLPDNLLEAFAGHSVLLLGWAEVPEQSSPEQVRAKLEEEASDDLERLASRLRDVDLEVESDLAFTGDLVQTLEDVAMDREVDAILVLRPGTRVRRILVPVPQLDMGSLRERFRSAGAPVADLHAAEGAPDTAAAVLDAAASHDLVVLGGAEEDGSIFGEVSERVLREGEGPVMVVRLPRLFGGPPDGEEAGPVDSRDSRR